MSNLKGRNRGSLLRHVRGTQSGFVPSSSTGGLLNHAPSDESFDASPPAIKSCVELLADSFAICQDITIIYLFDVFIYPALSPRPSIQIRPTFPDQLHFCCPWTPPLLKIGSNINS